ncbi:glycosyltransferase family protein [Ramlibacter rhizophilus]|nr:glycosyltransferase [Ramlibacter rhizophilus]
MDSYQRVADSVRRLLPQVDLLVGVSERVVNAYVEQGGYRGPTLLAPNGCDATFFESAASCSPAAPGERICIYQGGVNKRVDFALLLQLVRLMPDWEFRFCGQATTGLEGWEQLLREPNVRHLGALAPDALARAMCEATVGLIPFVQDRWIRNSLPLKAYEYVACGLPVVSIPIDALQGEPGLFRLADTAPAFADAVRAVAPSRSDPAALRERAAAARCNSYDARFDAVTASLRAVAQTRRAGRKRLNVAVLYDDGSVHVNTVREHLESFARYSRHQIVYVPATGGEPAQFRWSGRAALDVSGGPDLSAFDVVAVHYSARVSVEGHMPPVVEQALARFHGLKLLYIQDEYDTPEVTLRWIDRVQPDLVYTCVPAQDREKVYSSARFPATEFLPTLTGYVPEDASIDDHALPLTQRPLLIAYRGRKLPPIYGHLGYEKYLIGRTVRELADARGLPVDVEVDDAKRIYGADWYRFLGSARATLGTESGSNLFDFDGSAAALIERELARDPQADYATLEPLLRGYEQAVRMNQVSPKIFEAIRTRTALVLFEGEYSGVVRAGEHYIPLKRDFSNFDEVVHQLRDDAFVTALTTRAYDDVIRSGRWSYRTFVEGFDADIEQRVLRETGLALLWVPLFVRDVSGAFEHLQATTPQGLLLADRACDRHGKAALVSQTSSPLQPWLFSPPSQPQPQVAAEVAPPPSPGLPPPKGPLYHLGKAGWSMLPRAVQRGLGWRLRALAIQADLPPGAVNKLVAAAWTLTPRPAKKALRQALGGS